MPDNVALRRQGDGETGQCDTHQYGKAQELFRPVQGGAQFRPGVAYAADIVFFVVAGQIAEPGYSFTRAGDQQPVCCPAAGPDQAGGFQVCKVHQQSRGDIEHVAPAIGFVSQYFCRVQGRCPQVDVIADAEIQ